jgi:hypothetical protein
MVQLFDKHVFTKDVLHDTCRDLKNYRTTPSVYDTEIFVISHNSWSKQFENKPAT